MNNNSLLKLLYIRRVYSEKSYNMDVIDTYVSPELIKSTSLTIEATGCNDIIKYLNEIFNNWKTIELILKIESRPLQYLYNLKPKTIQHITSDQVEKIRKIINDIYKENRRRPFHLYPNTSTHSETEKINYYINKVKEEKYGIEKYILNREYLTNSQTVSGNLVNLIRYHLKSIEIFEEIINKRIQMYDNGTCKNWFHWFATLFRKDYSLSESSKNLKQFQFDIMNALKVEPVTLLDNFKTIQNKLLIITRTYNEYVSIKTTYETDIMDNSLSDKEQDIIQTTYHSNVQTINCEFGEQIDNLFNCFNICDSNN